jgi:hypothetical protein
VFEVWGSQRRLGCDGRGRRDFLKIGAASVCGLTLPGLLQGRALAARQGADRKDTSIIFLFLNGGPSQYETFDPKPDNPLPFRSVVGALKTNVPGTLIGGLFQNLSQHADKFSLIRAYTHDSADHADATHFLMTGHAHRLAAFGAAQNQPSLGAVLSDYRGAVQEKTLLPTYAKQDYIYAEGPDWLGASNNAFDIRGRAMDDMAIRIPQERLSDRRELLLSLDKLNRNVDLSGTMNALSEFEARAVDLVRGQAREAFDLSREDPKVREGKPRREAAAGPPTR